MPDQFKPTPEQIGTMIEEHRKWRFGEEGGKRADFSNMDLEGASLNGASLNGANLYGANLNGANLAGANLAGANLDGANLAGANLDGANLAGANLDGANLDGANLAGANLDGASLDGANLDRASLNGATGGITKTPVQISGLRYHVIITDTEITIGCQRHSLKKWLTFTDKQLMRLDSSATPEDLKAVRLVIEMAKLHCIADEPVMEVAPTAETGAPE